MLFCLFSTIRPPVCLLFFFFNDTATTEIYTLSLHDALPICGAAPTHGTPRKPGRHLHRGRGACQVCRSEEHTSELQSQSNLVCRLLLEKKTKRNESLGRRCRSQSARVASAHMLVV